jgi:hypothetical protein
MENDENKLDQMFPEQRNILLDTNVFWFCGLLHKIAKISGQSALSWRTRARPLLQSFAFADEDIRQMLDEWNRDKNKGRIGCHDEGSRRAWRSRRSRVGIKFIDPMNHTYLGIAPKIPKYRKP